MLKGVDLRVEPGERVALMGRNGAGKSTLLRTVAGLVEPVRGRVEAPGGMALLTQNPGDYLVRERVGDELPGEQGLAALRVVGLEHAVDADPRDLSGGERQRLALAIALAGRMEGERFPGLVALDEPTRGMDRARKSDLVELIEGLAGGGAGVVVATHDVEFAAAFAERVVLLGDGVAIADGPADRDPLRRLVLRHRSRPGARRARRDHPGAGRAVLARRGGAGLMSWELASFLILGARPARRLRLV